MSLKDRLGGLLEKIALLSIRSPMVTLLLAFLLTVVAGYFAKNIRIDPAIRSLIPEHRPVVRDYVRAEEDFQHTEAMISVVEIPEGVPRKRYRLFLREYQKGLEEIEELDAGRLALNYKFVSKVRDYLRQHGLLLMGAENLLELNRLLSPEVMSSKLSVNQPYRKFYFKQEFDPLDVLPLVRRVLPLGNRVTLDRSENLFLTKDPEVLFFLVGNDWPWEWDRTKRILKKAKDIEDQTWNRVMPRIQKNYPQQEFPRPKISWVGKAMEVLHLTDAIGETLRETVLITSLLIGILFFFFFRKIRSFILAYLPILAGITWSGAFVHFTVGKLNMLSVLCGALLIGLGIDFSAYLLNRFLQLREKDIPLEEAIRTTWRETGLPVLYGALTTIVAFSILTVSRLPAFRDIGLITCTGLFLTLTAVLMILPALLKVSEKSRSARPIWRYPRFLAKIPLSRPVWTLAISLLILGGLSGFLVNFHFLNAYQETYIMFRQPGEIHSDINHKFSELMDASLIPFRLIVEGQSWEEVLEKNEALVKVLKKYQKAGEISFFDSLSFWLPSFGQQEKIVRLFPQLKNLDAEKFGSLYRKKVRVLFKEGKVPTLQRGGYRIYGRELGKFLRGKNPAKPEDLKESRLEKILNHYLAENNGALSLSTYVYLPQGNYPEKKQALFKDLQKEPIFRKGEVGYPSVEGVIREIRLVLEEELLWLGSLALILSFLILCLAFRSLKMTLLALIPMALGGLAAIGAYTLIRGDFSVFNILWVPIYIGLATDDALHIGMRRELPGASLESALRGTGSMILLTSLTTMVAFGSTLFVELELQKRVSIWVLIAMGCELIASLMLFPALLKLMGGPRKTGENIP